MTEQPPAGPAPNDRPDGLDRLDGVGELVDSLAAVGRRLVRHGLVVGSGGNLSARVAGGQVCVVTSAGSWLDELTPAEFSAVRIADGAVLAGNPRPSSEVALHLASYRVRPDVNAVVHVHPQYAVLLHALGHQIRLLTTDHVYYVRSVRATGYHHPGTAALARAGAEAVADGRCDCVVLAHHGCSVVAGSVELACKRTLNLEEAAAATYRALLLGDQRTACPPEYRARLAGLESGRH